MRRAARRSPADRSSIRSRARRRLMPSAINRCCAPSWRSRSSRWRSAYPAVTIRAREARSSSTCARNSASSRSFSSVSAAVAPTARTRSRSSARSASWTIAADPPTFVLDDGRDLSLRRRVHLHWPARGVDVCIAIRHPIGELHLWVSKSLSEGIAQRSSTHPAAKPGDQRVDRLGLAEAVSQQTGQKCKRKTGQRAEQRQRQPVVDAARQAGLFDDQRRHQQHEREAADGEDGGKAPPLTLAAVTPAPVEDRHDRAEDCDRDVQLRRADDPRGRVGVIDQQRIGGALGAPLLRITQYERGQPERPSC